MVSEDRELFLLRWLVVKDRREKVVVREGEEV